MKSSATGRKTARMRKSAVVGKSSAMRSSAAGNKTGGTREPARARKSAGMRKFPAVRNSFGMRDRKSTRLNSSHSQISYAVFCLKKKKKHHDRATDSRGEHLYAYVRTRNLHAPQIYTDFAVLQKL